MERESKIVSSLPIGELWAGPRLVSTIKVRDLDASQVVDLLRSELVRFVIAEVGKPLQWVPNNERYDFWKNVVKSHFGIPESSARFADEYYYLGCEWKSYDGDTIVLLSKCALTV